MQYIGKETTMTEKWRCFGTIYSKVAKLQSESGNFHKLYKPNECDYIKVAIKECGHVEWNACWKREIDVTTNPTLDWL
jgi:hypothetical protein